MDAKARISIEEIILAITGWIAWIISGTISAVTLWYLGNDIILFCILFASMGIVLDTTKKVMIYSAFKRRNVWYALFATALVFYSIGLSFVLASSISKGLVSSQVVAAADAKAKVNQALVSAVEAQSENLSSLQGNYFKGRSQDAETLLKLADKTREVFAESDTTGNTKASIQNMFIEAAGGKIKPSDLAAWTIRIVAILLELTMVAAEGIMKRVRDDRVRSVIAKEETVGVEPDQTNILPLVAMSMAGNSTGESELF